MDKNRSLLKSPMAKIRFTMSAGNREVFGPRVAGPQDLLDKQNLSDRSLLFMACF
jgi:hypothetical protein